jgi:hypothetical protein
LNRNTSYEALKVTITVSGPNAHGEMSEHADTVDFTPRGSARPLPNKRAKNWKSRKTSSAAS